MPEKERDIQITGDGNIIGDDNVAHVVKQNTTIGSVTGAVHTGSGDIQFSSEETVDNVTGDIRDSILASRDVSNAMAPLNGRPISTDREPTLAELKQLLVEIQQELAGITTQRDGLQEISPAAPFTVQGAEQSVEDAAKKIAGGPEMQPEAARSIQRSLTEAANLLGFVLDGARTVAEEAIEASSTVGPLAETLGPLVKKVSVAASWVAKL